MITSLGEAVARRGTASAAALRGPRDARLDPAFTLELQQLLAHCLAGELKFIRELGDRRRTLTFKGEQDRATTIGELINGNNGRTLLVKLQA